MKALICTLLCTQICSSEQASLWVCKKAFWTWTLDQTTIAEILKIIHLMRDGSGKVAWLESNHFVGSSPTGGDIFFWNLILIGLFFTYSHTLESRVINLRGQENHKTQKFVQEMREIAIAIYLCTHTCTWTL